MYCEYRVDRVSVSSIPFLSLTKYAIDVSASTLIQVRWADIEERKHLEHRRKIGFCIGTDWSIFTNPDAEIPQ